MSQTNPRMVETPAEIEQALAQNAAARAAFEKLSPSHRREHIQHISEAKTPETRRRRIEKMIEKLLAAWTRTQL